MYQAREKLFKLETLKEIITYKFLVALVTVVLWIMKVTFSTIFFTWFYLLDLLIIKGIVHCRGDVTFGYSLKQNNLHQNPEVIMQVGADGELTIAPPEAIPSNKDTEEYEDFIANPSYEAHAMKFKQIAVGHGFICGIQYIDEDIFCWGNDDKELLVTTMKGPFRMVSVSDDQVCGILSGSNKLKCLHENALTQMENVEWDQIKVGNIGRICGVTMSSELKCVHPSATDDELKDFIVA